jgi:TonB family protein
MPALTSIDLFEGPAPRPRSWAAVATSASFHVAALVGVVVLARVGPAPAPRTERQPLTFVMTVPPRLHTPPLRLPAIRPAERLNPEHLASIDLAKPEATTPAPKALARSEPAPALPEPPAPAPPAVAPPTPVRAPAPVTVGLFAESVPAARETPPARVVRDAGFEVAAPVARLTDAKPAAVVGAFDTATPGQTSRTPRSGTTVGAFDTAAPGSPPTAPRAGAVVASTGFNTSRAETTAAANARPPADVRSGGFDVQRSAPSTAPRMAPPPERVDIPVEILFKPTPVYTEEARRLKVEGDVLLDVEFAATGAVSVLQVVRGLGHGLDEAATTAARQIRFKPAQTSGRPITFRATVHIVFRLA